MCKFFEPPLNCIWIITQDFLFVKCFFVIFTIQLQSCLGIYILVIIHMSLAVGINTVFAFTYGKTRGFCILIIFNKIIHNTTLYNDIHKIISNPRLLFGKLNPLPIFILTALIAHFRIKL